MAPTSSTATLLQDSRFAAALALATLLGAVALLWQVGPGARVLWSTDASVPWAAFVFDVGRVRSELEGWVPADASGPTVIVFGSADCACTRRTEPHRGRVEAAYAPRGVRFLAPAAGAPLEQALARALPASPAAVVLDRAGRVVYAGPWSKDGSCLAAGGTGPVENVLDGLLDGAPEAAHSPLGAGCLCAVPRSRIRQTPSRLDRGDGP